ncbi:MAG: hypothetical protein B1H07_00985 [Campylobacteraceae bacterium 4484_166]|nr:MAG: hypothetical protein B1H07_00985 [Campylobacteraceae bacterium 4484_166]
MLIVGEKYSFIKLESKQLNKKFNNIETITYKDKTPCYNTNTKVDDKTTTNNTIDNNSLKMI